MNPAQRALRVFALLVGIHWTCHAAAAERPRHFVLEVDLAIERGGSVGLLWDFGNGFWPDQAVGANVAPGATPSTIRLQLPTRPIRHVRFDPTADDSSVLITGLRLLDDRGQRLLTIDPRTLRPMHQIQSIVPEGSGVRVNPLPKADDPMLQLDLPPLQKRMHDAMGRRTVGRGAVALLGIGLGVLLLSGVVLAWRALGAFSARGAWVGGAAVFLLVFGARLAWLNLHARPVPFWDEWEGDVLYVLIPYVGGFLDWGALVMPQWEHRILLTRVITLFGTLLNGEWDPRVAMAVSAAMFAAAIGLVGTALLGTRRLPGAIAAIALAAAAALPYDFNNLLWGGQTQMYGLVLMAVCTIGLAAAPRITSAIQVGAFAAGAVSLFTMGAGPVGPGCAAGICLVRCWFEPAQRRRLAALAAIFIGVAGVGVALHVTSRAHLGFYATSFAQFQRAFLGVLAWPLTPGIVCAALLWVPWAINGVLVVRRREATPLEWLAIGLGTWALINAIALGYARQYEGPPFDSRFFTPISVGTLASLCSSVALALRWPPGNARALTLLGAGAVAAGWLVIGSAGLAGARESGVTRTDHDQRIRLFLAQGDRTPVIEKPPNHTGRDVADRLESPLLQPVLPAAYRRVLAARAGASTARIEAGPVTAGVRALMLIGPGLAALGALGLGLLAWRNGGREAVQRLPAAWREMSADVRIDRACYVAAVVLTLGWTIVYNGIRRDGLVDEPGHLADVHHFMDNKSGWPEAMPMLPGYHFMVLSLWRLHPAMTTLTAARLTTAAVTLVGLAAFALAWRRLHGRPAGRATLLLALCPLTQPFTGMVYTDMPALAFALCAAWGQVTGRRAFAALALFGAVAIRQTSLAWAGFFIAWEFFREDEPRATFLRRTAWLLGLIALATAIVAVTGRLTVGTQHGNQFQFNVATLHTVGLLILLLGLPLLVTHAPAVWRRVRDRMREQPTRTATWGFGGVALTAVFTLTFSNPHIWNRELFWPGCSFTLLRNWPLVWIDAHPWLRALSGLNLVLMTGALALLFAPQPHRRALWLVMAVGLLPALTNGLVEPRYFIPGVGFLLLFLEWNARDLRRLACWWLLLSALHAPFVARALSLW